MMSRGTRSRSSLALSLAALGLALAVPAGATAATKPTATTGGTSNVGQSSASLNATVNPNGGEAGYFFQYGTSRTYDGGQTPLAIIGSGTKRVKVAQGVGGLAPATTYHYRVVAQNPKGRVFGSDRTFKTQRQPLGVSLAGNPNPVRTGAGTTLAGSLTGTGNANRQVLLQSNPWPYTQGFLPAGNPQVTDANGNFAFPILSVNVNTQFRVVMPQKPQVASPVVLLGTKVKVTTHVRVRRGSRSGVVRLSGSLLPAMDGTQVLLQKFVNGKWTNIASTNARHANSSRSTYAKSVRQRHPGRYRVYHNAPEPHVPNTGTTVRVRHVRG
jgi:hypothetical protein